MIGGRLQDATFLRAGSGRVSRQRLPRDARAPARCRIGRSHAAPGSLPWLAGDLIANHGPGDRGALAPEPPLHPGATAIEPHLLLEVARDLVPGRLDDAIADLERPRGRRASRRCSAAHRSCCRRTTRSIANSNEGSLGAVSAGASIRPLGPWTTRRSPSACARRETARRCPRPDHRTRPGARPARPRESACRWNAVIPRISTASSAVCSTTMASSSRRTVMRARRCRRRSGGGCGSGRSPGLERARIGGQRKQDGKDPGMRRHESPDRCRPRSVCSEASKPHSRRTDHGRRVSVILAPSCSRRDCSQLPASSYHSSRSRSPVMRYFCASTSRPATVMVSLPAG